ncbi:hypothetical protein CAUPRSCDRAFT_4181, partial [Caulochytrium protostelioides]
MDAAYTPPRETERREVLGLQLSQSRNTLAITPQTLTAASDAAAALPAAHVQNLVVASIAAKYTQSNSVVYAARGQTVGIGAGQQSRIHCTRLAGDKADLWRLRHHPRTRALSTHFKRTTKRAERANAIDAFVSGALDDGVADPED